jgi:hypothetical protein
MKPDGSYSLDMSQRQDRIIARALIHLEAVESARRVKGLTDVSAAYVPTCGRLPAVCLRLQLRAVAA